MSIRSPRQCRRESSSEPIRTKRVPRMNVLRTSFFAATFVLCALTPVSADEVDDYVKSHLRQLHIPGASVAIVRDGRIIKAKSYGLANVEWNVPATNDTVYELGSVTKQFTATAIMMLVEEGKVGLDETKAHCDRVSRPCHPGGCDGRRGSGRRVLAWP